MALLTLDDAKGYLRVDSADEDAMIGSLLSSAGRLCMDVARIEDAEEFAALGDTAKTAVLYATAYLYEHREEADHHALTLTLRSLLFGVRKEGF